MKVTNWLRKLAGAMLAAGIWIPATALAQNIQLGDPSFEDFIVPSSVGWAYSDTYRPTSAWVDDLYSTFPPYIEDDGNSNWLYDAAYDSTRRPAPRTGNQAMHGFDYYNAQIVDAVFEAGQTYTFSLWAQGDSDASGSSSRVWMYLFDASSPLTSFDAQSLVAQRFAPDTGDFINRTPGSIPAESQAEWTQISISHTVGSGVPEIGHPIGVAFWVADDGAVDDAILTRSSESVLLILQVNTITGATKLMNTTGAPIDIDYYEIISAGVALNSIAWNSLQDQDYEGNGLPGTGNGWEEAGNVGSSVLAESYLRGSSMIDDAETISLGNAFNPSVFGAGNDGDLVFHYGLTTGVLYSGLVVYDDTPGQDQADFDSDGDIDGADFLAWQKGFGMTGTATRADGDANGDSDVDSADLKIWKDQFGTSGSASDLTGQAVPEPNALGLFTLILAGMGIGFTQIKK